MEKHSVSRLSYLFAHLYLLSSYSFSSDLLSSNLPLLSASALLCFSSLHIVGSLTSKLPSIIYITYYHVDSTNGSKWWITETNRERTPRRLNYGTLIGRSPLGRLSGWDPGPSSITTTSLVWAESTKNTPGNAE